MAEWPIKTAFVNSSARFRPDSGFFFLTPPMREFIGIGSKLFTTVHGEQRMNNPTTANSDPSANGVTTPGMTGGPRNPLGSRADFLTSPTWGNWPVEVVLHEPVEGAGA